MFQKENYENRKIKNTIVNNRKSYLNERKTRIILDKENMIQEIKMIDRIKELMEILPEEREKAKRRIEGRKTKKTKGISW